MKCSVGQWQFEPNIGARDLIWNYVVNNGLLGKDAPVALITLDRRCGCRFSHDFARPFPSEHVRLTSIYSKGDGVVHW